MNDDHDNATTDRETPRVAQAQLVVHAAGELHQATIDGAEDQAVYTLARDVVGLASGLAHPLHSAAPPGQVLAAARRVVKSYAERPDNRATSSGDLFEAVCALDEAIDAHDAAGRS